MKKKILFISCEDTLIRFPSTYCHLDKLTIDKLVLEPYVIPTLLTLQQSSFRLVMIIHQNSLHTTGFCQADVNKFNFNLFTSQGIVFDDVLICYQQTTEQCGSNKSKQWLKLSHSHDEIDINHSYIISDRENDFKLLDYMGISYLHYQRKKLNWPAIGKKLTCIDRYAQVNRTTQETAINVEVWLDREGDSIINTGIGFFDHMLNQIATHGGLRMNISMQGDLHIDDHHTVEDTALAIGEAINTALGDKHGISRFGFVLPMDECLACCALDISGRPYLKYKVKYSSQRVGDLSIEMVEHFFRSLSYAMACTLHLRTNGKNNHHLVESLFKAFGRTLRQAIKVEGNTLPSSKGII